MKELCVRCGKETEYLISTPIEVRKYFIEGAGQLCPECWRRLWPRQDGPENNVPKSVKNDCKTVQILI